MKNNKIRVENTNLVNYVIIGTFFILTLIIPGMFLFASSSLHNSIILEDINGINVIIGILAIISCAFYYNMYKDDIFFILTLNYIIIYIEYIIINILLYKRDSYYLNIENIIIVSYLIRVILLTIALLNNGKAAKFIIKKRKISIIIILSINIMAILLELYLRSNFTKFFTSKFMITLNLLLMIYYFILLFILAKRCFIEKKFIYAIIVSSLSILNFRRLFCNNFISIDNSILIEYTRFLSFISFTMLIIGLLIKIDMNVKDNERLKTEVENSEKKLLAITKNIKELIILEDINGKITYVNEVAISALGYKLKDLLGNSIKNILHNETNKIYNEEHNIIFAEEEWKCKNGKLFSTESIISYILDDNNNFIGKMIVARDSSFKSELDNLKIKYKEMKELETLRTQFFANLSHEIRTPINIIYSCIQLLDRKKLINDKELANSYKKYESTITQNCFRILRLINNIVDITKIDAGFMKAQFTNYDIVSLIENITLSIVPYVESKNIHVIFDTIVEELEIKCDPDNIERIILNLLSNSVKYTNQGGNILVSIDCDDTWVTIKVKDDGMGIPSKFKHTIFERFVQTDKSFNRQKEGSGIGLALAKSLVNFHNGEIYLSDNIDNGTEFVIKLPNIRLDKVKDSKNGSILETSEKSLTEKISIEFSDIYDLN